MTKWHFEIWHKCNDKFVILKYCEMIPKNDFSKVISPDMFTHVCYGPHKPSRIPKKSLCARPKHQNRQKRWSTHSQHPIEPNVAQGLGRTSRKQSIDTENYL